jgi:hypothetical protein
MRTIKKAVVLCGVIAMPLYLVSGIGRTAEPSEAAPVAPASDSEEAGSDVEGFRMSLKASKAAYASGEAINLEVVFKNISRESVWLVDSSLAFAYKLEVLRPDGKIAPLTAEGQKTRESRGRRRSFSGGLVNPGSKHEFPYTGVQTVFEMSKPGEYQLRVSREVPSIEDPKKQVTLYSNVVKIRIEAPQEDE